MIEELRHIDLRYDNADSQQTALALVLALCPEWEDSKDTIEFVRFTDGITNTLLKAVNMRPGLSRSQIDRDAVLIRAYGRGTAVLIDRDRECASHSLLASHKLAPPLLARFNNGLMYRFIEGKVSSPADLRRPEVYRGVARKLAEWHATLPISAVTRGIGVEGHIIEGMTRERRASVEQIEGFTPLKPTPNIWTVMRKWILALPTSTEKEAQRKEQLREELRWLYLQVGDTPGIANQPLVFGHCDLLSGNVIIQTSNGYSPPSSSASSPAPSSASSEHPIATVSFIDYEYATPSPAAFDIANHFAEWGGFDCDFSVLPTRSQRRDFVQNYLASYNSFLDREYKRSDVDQLFAEIDLFRGAPGFYWGIWALIQATISQIDFDYASYAEVRLGEYWNWKEAHTNTRKGEVPLRERRWAQEED